MLFHVKLFYDIGTIKLAKSGAIDRDANQFVTISVLASDSIHTTTTQVVVGFTYVYYQHTGSKGYIFPSIPQ